MDDGWTILPEDSISCFSSSDKARGRRSSRSSGESKSFARSERESRRGEQVYYDQERTVVSSSSRRRSGDARIRIANEKLVIEVRPMWA